MKNIITLLIILLFTSCQTDYEQYDLCVEMPTGYYTSEMTNKVLYIDMSSNYAEEETNVKRQYKIFINECQVELSNEAYLYNFELIYSVEDETLVWHDGITYDYAN